MKTHGFIALLLFFGPVTVQAQPEPRPAPPVQWHHLDPEADKNIGISTDRAYELLKLAPAHRLPKPTRPIIVAVIDGGVDINHEDLKSVRWTNTKEIAGNGKDDDGNGYVDDVHGWNFLGLNDGHTLGTLQKEETRLHARLKPLYEGKNRALFSPNQQVDYDLYQQVKPYYTQKRAETESEFKSDSLLLAADKAHVAALQKAFGVSRIDTALLHKPPTTDTTLLRYAREYYRDLRPIISITPKGAYGPGSGTSMATPVVVGIGAVLKTYFPNLSPADLKRIILQSAVPYHTLVLKPGTKQKVDFATLSKTGAIVNLYEAVKLAIAEQR